MKNIIGTKISKRTIIGVLMIVIAFFVMIFTEKIVIPLVISSLFVAGVLLIVFSIKRGGDENSEQ
jgi:hypothetical protein